MLNTYSNTLTVKALPSTAISTDTATMAPPSIADCTATTSATFCSW